MDRDPVVPDPGPVLKLTCLNLRASKRHATLTGGGWECRVLVPSGLTAVVVPTVGYLGGPQASLVGPVQGILRHNCLLMPESLTWT
jgi:hypothetical protein